MTCKTCTTFYHCDEGNQLWLCEINAQTDYNKARRDLALALDEHVDTRACEERLRGATLAFRRARTAYDHHMGIGNPPAMLDLAYERVLGKAACQSFPAECQQIVAELVRLYQAVGEPVPAALGGTTTPAPTWAQTTTQEAAA